MTKLLSITLSICVVALCGGALLFGWRLYPHLTGALDAWTKAAPNLQPTLDKANQALDTVNTPCKGDEPCRGTLGVLNKTIVKVGDAVVTTQMQERNITPHTIAAVDALKDASGKLGDSAKALTGTLDEGKKTIQAAQPLLASLTTATDTSNTAIQHFDALLTSKDLNEGLHHFNGVTASMDSIGQDAYTRLHPILNPDPCTGRWCWVKNGYGRMEALFPALDAFWKAKTAFSPVRVRVVP